MAADIDLRTTDAPVRTVIVTPGTAVKVALPRKNVAVRHMGKLGKTVAASNSPTAGSSKTINLADTGNLAANDYVQVSSGGNVEIAKVTGVVANVSITVDSLTNGHTTPNVTWAVDDSAVADTGADRADRLYVGHAADTLDPTSLPQVQLPLFPGDQWTFQGAEFKPDGANGDHVLQLNADKNKVLVCLVVGEIARVR